MFVLPWNLNHPGGVNQVVINLFHQAQRSGRWRPVVYVNAWAQSIPLHQTVDERATVYFRLYSPRGKKHPALGLLMFLFHLPRALARLRRILSRDNIRVVNVHYPSLSALTFSVLRRLGGFKGKLVLSFHGLDIEDALQAHATERWMWGLLLNSADVIITCSAALKLRATALAPDCAHKVQVVYNGLDSALLEAERDPEYRLAQALDQRPFILNVGTFQHVKGQDILLEAFQKIAGEFSDLVLVLVGRTGPALTDLKAQARHYQLTDRVHFFENIPHTRVSVFYERATLFCLPSRLEAFGIVLLEAGHFNLPVVASRVGGVPEVIVDGKHGRLVPPNDAVTLAAALRQLLADPPAARLLGKNLQSRVAEHFTWNRAFHQYEQLLSV